MPVDPQEFGEVKANVTTILTALNRIEPKLDGLVTEKTFNTSMGAIEKRIGLVEGSVGLVDKRVGALEEIHRFENKSFWGKIRANMSSMIVFIIAAALVLGIGGMVVSYFSSTYHPTVIQGANND